MLKRFFVITTASIRYTNLTCQRFYYQLPYKHIQIHHRKMSVDPNRSNNKHNNKLDNKNRIDKSKLKFDIDKSSGKVIGTYNNDQVAFVEFTLNEKLSILNINRTVTYPKYRGNGIAEQITKALFEYSQEQNYAITSDCWYTDVFLKKPHNIQYNKIYKSKM
eukprot:410301_1